MAEGTIVSILAFVGIILVVAGETIGGYTCVLVIHVTIGAGNLGVFSGQFVSRDIMVESSGLPI